MISQGYDITTRRHAHTTLWNELANQTDLEFWSNMSPSTREIARQLGNAGFRLNWARILADYEDEYPRLAREVGLELRRAADMHEWFSQL